ncbi:vacuolar protein sorting-associated protein 41 homolog [Nilaparvata lugens]|uniref:vacuolar protein sorting-associated protein 41 homolog n=1 Tax=Nilaparvata lugens TaxID=108931 RepID=UPI00193EB0AE|nr:vacuolar protein sorting-associated protein 41 homolog [Nilaparvata lugens]
MENHDTSAKAEQNIDCNGKKEEEAEEEDDGDDDDEDSLSEEVEPKLKYTRMTHDLANILFKDAASCVALHPKFICVGTRWGSVYLLDHQGNKSQSGVTLRSHSVSVNQISMDAKGEHVATCSDDGKVFVYGLDNVEDSFNMEVPRLVRCVAIDPLYYQPRSGSRFVTGDERLVLHEKAFFSRFKSTILSEAKSEGGVQNIRWSPNGFLIAWTTNLGVRIYDLNARCSLGLIKWTRTSNASFEIVGSEICCVWVAVCTFQTEFVICGVAPLGDQLVVLGWCQDGGDGEGGEPQRPQLHVIEPRAADTFLDASTDSLTLRGYQHYSANDYHLECLVEENQFVVVSPKDIILASPYNADDRVDWLLEHCKFEAAMEAVTSNSGSLMRHTILSVGRSYLDHLLSLNKYHQAAKLCVKILGNHSLKSSFTLPVCRNIMNYQNVLLHSLGFITYVFFITFVFVKFQGFLSVVKEWSPKLYNVPAVINAVMEIFLVGETSHRAIFLEALAILYSHDGQYSKSLAMYLKLKNIGVFDLIHQYSLYDVIHDKIEGLMELDSSRAVTMLLEKERVSPDVVVARLQNNKMFLFLYLDALEEKRDMKVQSRKYHSILVRLYADFAREKLLPLLRRSDHYPIQEALNICKQRRYNPEMVYLLGRIGNTKEALDLIIKELKDIEQAINFCKEHDDEDLWEDLINHSLKVPEYITFLLQRIGTYVDPRILIQRIQDGFQIPGLKNSLVKIITDYNLQVSVQEGCKKIVVSDYFNLHNRLVSMQQRGTCVDDEKYCGACHRKIIMKDLSQADDILMFYCNHSFHKQCLPALGVVSCTICRSQRSDISHPAMTFD